MKFVDEYYVGFQNKRYSDTEDQRVLGFMTPKDNTKAFENRKDTVDRWRDKKIEPRVVKNEPLAGFKFRDVVSRYSTSNKLFRMLDPRGYEIEITSENLFHLIGTTAIVKGEIMDKLVYARTSSSKPWLISSDQEEYKNYLKDGNESVLGKKTSVTKKDVWYKHKAAGIYYRNHGLFFYNLFHAELLDEYSYGNRFSYSYYRDEHASKITLNMKLIKTSALQEEKIYVYSKLSIGYENKVSHEFEARKSPYRSSEIEEVDVSEVPQSVQNEYRKSEKQFEKDIISINRRDMIKTFVHWPHVSIWNTGQISYVFLFTDKVKAKTAINTKEDAESLSEKIEYDKMLFASKLKAHFGDNTKKEETFKVICDG